MKKTLIALSVLLAFLVGVSLTFVGTTAFSQQNGSPLPKSKLGVEGEMGFIISIIDPGSPLQQAGLEPGDIITGLNGQVTSIEKFQSDIATSAPGTAFEIRYLRFNSTSGKLEENTVAVKTVSFPSQPMIKKISFSSIKLECPDSCCADCDGLVPYEQTCITADHFTGKGFCFIKNGKCTFYYCVCITKIALILNASSLSHARGKSKETKNLVNIPNVAYFSCSLN